jgi:hypothetical protein
VVFFLKNDLSKDRSKRASLKVGQTHRVPKFTHGLDTKVHSYRLEVRGHQITFFQDGQQINQALDTSYTNAGYVGLLSYHTAIIVMSFKVFAL